MTTPSILVEKHGAIGYLVFNRPKEMNSFNVLMSEELPLAVATLKHDPDVDVVCLYGNGPVFMAGGDVRYFAAHLRDNLPQKILPLARALHQTIIDLQTMDKPVVASVHGAVAGAGLSIMCAADLVIASTDTIFTTAYSQLGLSGDGGVTYFLPRVIGRQRAMELMFLSDRFDAARALELGLVNVVCADSDLKSRTTHYLNRLASGPRQAYSEIKRLLKVSETNSLESQLELEAHAMSGLAGTEEFAARVNAFVSKNKE